jgi:membrane protease subunit HflK
VNGEAVETGLFGEAKPRSGGWRRWRRAALAAAVLLWLASGMYTVASNETGVVTRFGKVHERTRPGLHYALPWPIDRVQTPTTTDVKRIEVGFTQNGELWAERRRSDMLTGDENILKLMMVVQYKVRDPVALLFSTEEPVWLIEKSVESALSAYVASMNVDDVLTSGKAEIEIEVVKRAQKMLDAYDTGIVLLGGNLKTVSPPEPVIEAFNDVTRAKKDAERLVEDARMVENTVVPQARGEAEKIVNEARGNADLRVHEARGSADRFTSLLAEYERDPKLTRTRLYIETMERVLDKVDVVLVEDGSKVTILDDQSGSRATPDTKP